MGGWNDEGIGWYSASEESIPLYREYNPNATTGTHNYTTNSNEDQLLVSSGWNAEGIGWYATGDVAAAEAQAATEMETRKEALASANKQWRMDHGKTTEQTMSDASGTQGHWELLLDSESPNGYSVMWVAN